jgi:hypothetical protein
MIWWREGGTFGDVGRRGMVIVEEEQRVGD